MGAIRQSGWLLVGGVLALSTLACTTVAPIRASFQLGLMGATVVAPSGPVRPAAQPASGGFAPAAPPPPAPLPGFSLGISLGDRFSLQRVAGDATGGDALGLDALSASFRQLAGIVTDPTGMIYVCDPLNNQIRSIPPSGPTTLAAGALSGVAGFSGDNLPALASLLNAPMGLARDAHSGVLFYCDSQNGRIRYFSPFGRVYTYAGGGLDPSDTVAAAADAQLDQPFGLALDAAGNLYFTERGTGRVRKVDGAGVLTTLATLTPGQVGPIVLSDAGDRLWVGDGPNVRVLLPSLTPALQATSVLAVPGQVVTGLAYDQFADLYVALAAVAPFGLKGTTVKRMSLGSDGFLAAGQIVAPVAGSGEQSADDQDYSAPVVTLPDARSQLLAGASYCSLYMDLHHASDPGVLSGLLYAGNTYADGAGKQWAQLLRLTPGP